MQQQSFDFSQRGHQLRLLDRVQLPSCRHGSRQVSGAACKAVLKAIDSCIGLDPCWQMAIARLMEICQLSRATVNTALAVLARERVVEITHLHQRVDGNLVQLPSRYRIVWSNLADFDRPAVSPVETPRAPEVVATVRESSTEPGRLSVSRGSAQCEPGVSSAGAGGQLSVSRRSAQCEPLPVQALTRTHQPPSASARADTGRQRRCLPGWLTGELITTAVRDRDRDTLQRIVTAVAPDSARAGLATLFDASTARSPAGLLAWRMAESLLTQDEVSPAAWRWAGQILSHVTPEQSCPCPVCGSVPGDRTGCDRCRPRDRQSIPARGLSAADVR